MKRATQKTGIRPYFGNELVELQTEPLNAIDAMLSAAGNCVISGCEITATGDKYDIARGYVAIAATDQATGTTHTMAMPFDGITGVTLPIYLTSSVSVVERAYEDGAVKPIAYNYRATAVAIKPPDVASIEITPTYTRRLSDALAEALTKYVVVTTTEKATWGAKETPEGAQAKADAAKAGAVAAAATDATTKANTAKTEAVATAAADATTKANTAKTEAIAAAAVDATTKANNTKTAAAADATTKANTAKTEAVATAAADASTKANTAKTEAVATAAADATTKANTAKTEAIAAAAVDATTKANNTKTAAAADATTKANTAKTEAVAAAKTYTDSTKYVHPADANTRHMTDAEKTKLAGIATGANKYVHPATHSIPEIAGLQLALDGKVNATANNGLKSHRTNTPLSYDAVSISPDYILLERGRNSRASSVKISYDGIFPADNAFSMPGVLLWAGCNGASYTFYKGPKKHATNTISRQSVGVYRVYHSIGHKEYAINVGIGSSGRWCGTWYWENQNTNYVDIVICGLDSVPADKTFTVTLTGSNTI